MGNILRSSIIDVEQILLQIDPPPLPLVNTKMCVLLTPLNKVSCINNTLPSFVWSLMKVSPLFACRHWLGIPHICVTSFLKGHLMKSLLPGFLCTKGCHLVFFEQKAVKSFFERSLNEKSVTWFPLYKRQAFVLDFLPTKIDGCVTSRVGVMVTEIFNKRANM